MADEFVGEIRMFGGSYEIAGWEFCDGQLMPISENDVLFTLIGTTYGGDGQATFALPNLQGRVPIHQGTGNDGINYQIGETGGVEEVTLTTTTIPQHSHLPVAASTSTTDNPAGSVWANTSTGKCYSPDGVAPTTLSPQSVGPAGGNQPHENMIPYLCVTYIISMFGLFPSPT